MIVIKRKHIRAVLWSSLVLVLVVVGIYFILNKKFVPSQFTQARQDSAQVAKDIVILTEASIQNLDVIALRDRQFRFKEALLLVEDEFSRAQDSRGKAIKLTQNLAVMARSAAGITPKRARDLAIEAISSELSLITHLIVYNDVLNSLLKTLEFKFSGDIRYDSEEVQNLVKNMNQEAREVNTLNELFNQKMREFDGVAG